MREALRDKLTKTLTDLGGSAGNGRMLTDLGWQEETYVSVRDELVEDGLIVRGRGRGGSIALAGGEISEQPVALKPSPRLSSKPKGNARSVGRFEQTFNALDKVLRNEAGQTTELDYTEQSSWMLFLKYLDDLEQQRRDEAELKGERYRRSSMKNTVGPHGRLPRQ